MAISLHHHKVHQIVHSFESRELKKRPLIVRIADFFTTFFGSTWFLALNIIIYSAWVLHNTGRVRIPGLSVFDPYPFLFLSMTVSLEAIFLTTLVLISQNRQNLIGSLRNEMDLHVNLIAEKEITKILRLLHQLSSNLGHKIQDKELEEMLKGLDTSYIERKLEEELTGKSQNISEVMKPLARVAEKVEKDLSAKQ